MSMRHRTREGRLAYAGPAGGRGREYFAVTVHTDGRRILRARSEIDEGEVLRDVLCAVDADWRPLDAFVRLTVEDRFVGTGWSVFDEEGGACESFNVEDGRLSQVLDAAAPLQTFGSHAIASDAWMTTAFDFSRPDEDQWVTGSLISSLAFNGSTGPRLHRISYGLRYRGRETLEVPAGTLESHHFEFLFEGTVVDYHPPYHVWTTADDDRLIVQAHVGEPKDYLYQLVDLTG
jgi:hypothetical protein